MSLLVRVIAPTGRDAEMIAAVLNGNGVSAQVGDALTLFPAERSAAGGDPSPPLGPLLIAEEALTPQLLPRLTALMRDQPPWSDLPLLILTASGREMASSRRPESNPSDPLDPLDMLGFPVLLERPIHTATLVSSVKAALRARQRQYEIRDALASLKDERETLQTVLENLPVGIVVAKSSGEIVLGNRRVEEIFRHPMLPSPDVESHGQWVAYHPDGRRVLGREFPLARAMQTGQPVPPEEFLYGRGDGSQAWVSLTAAPILNEGGTVTGGVVAISDIDGQKRSEAALIQSEKLAAVGRLAASISHEINNPLEAVTNLLFLARQSQNLPAEVRSYLDTADGELGRVSQIVSHTLRFHRQSTRPRAVSAQELLEPTLGLYSGRLANAGITLHVQHRGTSSVTCYEGEIRQTLNNLVGNAIEAMRTGGRLVIRTQDSSSWKTGEPGVRISIADTGYGMTPEVQKRVFEAFYTTKGINGTGLGLWISHGIVEKHRGMLHIRSSVKPEGSGTVFELFLPCNPFREADRQPRQEPVEHAFQ